MQDAVAARAYAPYYMHRTSHWMGMDVHDCGSYAEPGAPRQADGALPSRVLRPGMVLTVEPGLYVRAGSAAPEKFWNTGIRIEDDALITAEVLVLWVRKRVI